MIQTIINYAVIIAVVVMIIIVLIRKMKLKGKGSTGEVLILNVEELNTVKWALKFPDRWTAINAGVISETKRLNKNAKK